MFELLINFLDMISVGAGFIPVIDNTSLIINGILCLVMWIGTLGSLYICILIQIEQIQKSINKKVRRRQLLQAKKIQLKKHGLL